MSINKVDKKLLTYKFPIHNDGIPIIMAVECAELYKATLFIDGKAISVISPPKQNSNNAERKIHTLNFFGDIPLRLNLIRKQYIIEVLIEVFDVDPPTFGIKRHQTPVSIIKKEDAMIYIGTEMVSCKIEYTDDGQIKIII